MTITNIWAVVQMDCYPEEDGETEVVFTVHWTLAGTDGTYTGGVYGSQAITIDPAAPFTAYADLTEAQVIGWVQSAMGAEQVTSYEASVAAQIENQTDPPIVTSALPWAARRAEVNTFN